MNFLFEKFEMLNMLSLLAFQTCLVLSDFSSK